MTDAKPKDNPSNCNDRLDRQQLEKPALNTPEGQQVRNATGDQVEAIKTANPDAHDGSATPKDRTWRQKQALIEEQSKSLELFEDDKLIAARVMEVEKPAEKAMPAAELDKRPIYDYDWHFKPELPSTAETGVEYRVGYQVGFKKPEITEQALYERVAALPLDKQAQVLHAGIQAYHSELNNQQFRMVVGHITGVGESVVGMSQGADSLGKSICDVAQFSQDIADNNPRAQDTATQAGHSFGKLLVGGFSVVRVADSYLGSVGAASYEGDNTKTFRDISELGQSMNQRWAEMSTEEKSKFTTKLTLDNLGPIAAAGAGAKLAKSMDIAGALQDLGASASVFGAKEREKYSRVISQITEQLTVQPMGVTPDGHLMPIQREPFRVNAKDLVAEQRLYQSPKTGTVHTPAEAKALEGLDKKLSPNKTAETLKDQGWNVIHPKVYHVEGFEKPLEEAAMAKHLNIAPERLRAATEKELSTRGITAIEPVNGSLPINHEFAGKVYKLQGDLEHLYPNGVRFTKTGYPDFSPYVKEIRPGVKACVDIEYSGSRPEDFKRANKALGLQRTPIGYEWHHHENARTMQLVPARLHFAVRHTGGCATSGLNYVD